MEFHHTTVLLNEMIDSVLTDPHGIYVDCTLGGGGHSFALSQRLADDGLLIGIDQDQEAIDAAGERLKDTKCRHLFVRDNFSHMDSILASLGLDKVDGFIFDLGVSSHQLDDGERGFSYMNNGKLDMRMDRRNPLTAYEIVNTYEEEDLARIIKEYGEERWAKRIAKFIVEFREKKPIETTEDLVNVIKAAIPAHARRNGPHPAKRTFQAIRIEVNNELGILKDTMESCVNHLNVGGRLGVITFQSLEDRIIKRTFREMERDCICPPDLPVCVCHHHRTVKSCGKPIKPSDKEIEENPRARSAVLRVVERV
ncbi:16S rRNA (cytosine(1402)-N(4))-methyltransferase RsmH [uncultured Dialister sp.]|jgi:16S rRNA (cytosine1402-N4)-methyltransferase|uniref:16S rRNA (cytosine(1402)-N(4))-methyltransferase RsmH n=1 Tax=uncultured Dialister sp. TaxID=278064 RepID=UPI0025CE2032|nr:16S rRNA (cytosine(1402)-N(4))-methyltransferase RsmH [uncultured Dialister sp.]